jgi:hypothetical protein
MHKLHVIQRPDGSLLVIGVLNPGMPWHYAATNKLALQTQFGATATVVIVPYATHIETSSQSLWASLRSWWLGRKLKEVKA